jgi:hypothetical protein
LENHEVQPRHLLANRSGAVLALATLHCPTEWRTSSSAGSIFSDENGAVLKRRLPSWRRTGQPLRILLKSQNAPAKEPGSGAPTEPDGSLLTVRAAVSEVHLVFTVTDKHDHYIKDLKQNDFKILDDHKPPQQILSFQSETDLPLQVGLLIDTSQSVHDRFTFEQEAAIAFLKQTLRQKSDQAFVVGFNIKPQVTQDFTDELEKAFCRRSHAATGQPNSTVRCPLLCLP